MTESTQTHLGTLSISLPGHERPRRIDAYRYGDRLRLCPTGEATLSLTVQDAVRLAETGFLHGADLSARACAELKRLGLLKDEALPRVSPEACARTLN